MKRHLKRIRRRIASFRCARRFARLSVTVRVLLVASAATTTVIGCGWLGPSESVRFSGDGDERSYERLPPLSLKTQVSARRDDESDTDGDYQAEQRRDRDLTGRWEKATAPTAVRSELEEARRNFLSYLNETEVAPHDDYWTQSALTTQQRRNTARDLLDALTALDHGSAAEHAQAYLAARRAYDLWLASPTQPASCYYNCPTPAQQWREKDELKAAAEKKAVEFHDALDSVPRDANLDDNVAYLRAAALYREEHFDEAAQAFDALVAKFPRSEKRVAALFMYALAQLKQSASYVGGDATALSSDPCADCRDAAWTAARAAFGRVLKERTHSSGGDGRFASDARGWLAYTSLRVGDTAGALAEYYRLLADDTNKAARGEALNSLAMVRSHADDEAMNHLEADLSDEPEVALTYAYHDLYNYAAQLNIFDAQFAADDSDEQTGEPYSTVNSQRQEREQMKLVGDTQQKEFRRVAEFAKRMLRRYPRAATSTDFILRVAAASLELDDNRAAHTFAVRALALKVSGERREDALWIKGVAEYRLREYDAARRTLSELVGGDGAPPHRLTKGARILLALVAEDAGDLGGALEQYLLLDYTEDAAYFLDVLMSPEQLAAYITSHPQSAHLDELNYALGVRYLRAGRYAEARTAYARVHTSRGSDYSWGYNFSTGCNEPDGYNPPNTKNCESPKIVKYETADGIHEGWVLRDLKTAETLEWYASAVEQAQGDEAKAETLYQMASYLYESDLLFYNPAAWRGSRYYNLSSLAQSNNYRAPDEARRLFDYMQSHDMAARALPIYLEVVRRFPDTRAARDAFYTAAVCHERLAGYNDYWRGIYGDGLHAGAALVTYRDVRAAYPNYQMPRGTFGWQPSTRTVNGGPGWHLPPKPKPRPTRAARIKMFLVAWQPSIVNYWNYSLSRLRYWLNVALLLAATLIAGRVAARTRQGLRRELARHKPSSESVELTESTATTPATLQTESAPWLITTPATLGWMEQMSLRLKPHADALYRRLRRRVEPLLHDAHGRAALASNALAHTALIVLLFEFIRTVHAGM
ncbi:MAG TPA: tetratricopeptide repeat protein [Pyrinomonadaceae bacterium]|nr:tetratricopeptide repeat protein [Pyrinomonadaceae bacterium]